jgi:hypothetical protein
MIQKAKRVSKSKRSKDDTPVQLLIAVSRWHYHAAIGTHQTRRAAEPYWNFRHLEASGTVVEPPDYPITTLKVSVWAEPRLTSQDKLLTCVGGISGKGSSSYAHITVEPEVMGDLVSFAPSGFIRFITLTADRLKRRYAPVLSAGFRTEKEE